MSGTYRPNPFGTITNTLSQGSLLQPYTGCGSPEGVQRAKIGSVYWDYCGKGFWTKDSGNDEKTGWFHLIQGV